MYYNEWVGILVVSPAEYFMYYNLFFPKRRFLFGCVLQYYSIVVHIDDL